MTPDDFTNINAWALAYRITAAARDTGMAKKKLRVLSRQIDPYTLDSPTARRNVDWLAGFLPPSGTIHLRGLHYLIVSHGDVRRPNGSLYRNNETCWNWLSTQAKAARWLGIIPFERLVDERNAEPLVREPQSARAGYAYVTAGNELYITSVEYSQAGPAVINPVGRQPYRLVLMGEKASLAEVLNEVADEFDAEVVLATGEQSDTLIFGVARRAAEDGRPLRVCYFSDFDPSGWQMPVSVARKLQALRDVAFPELDIEVRSAALTMEQVRSLALPESFLKETENRADRWRAFWGHEQTEIDALAALRPDELRRIAREALTPFYDATLDRRCREAGRRLSRDLRERFERDPAGHAARLVVEAAHRDVEAAAARFEEARRLVNEGLAEQYGQVDIAAPEPVLTGTQPEPLFSSGDDFVTATLKMRAHRDLTGEVEE